MARKTTKPTVVKSPKSTKSVDAQQVETNKRTINKSPKSIKAVDSKSVEPIKPIVDKSPKLSKQVDDKPTKTEKQVGKFFVKKDSCVYVRYRQGKPPIRDEIRLLHPGIIDVRYPRQKSAKFCHLEFESKEAAIEGAKQMKIAHGKKMLIKYMKPPHDNSQNKSQNKSSDGESENVESSEEDEETSQVNTRQTKKKANLKVAKSHENQVPTKCLHVSGLPDMALKEVLQNLYPTQTEIEVLDIKLKGKRCALVHFGSEEDSVEAMKVTKDVCINGDMLTVRFHCK